MHLPPEAFQPRIGLSSIELADESLTPLLPDDSRLQPTDASVEAQLEEMLQAKTFEKVMLDALRPSVTDRSILRPGVFHPLRDQVLVKIQEALKTERDISVTQELGNAIELLQQLGLAHDLGEQYRYALLKG